MHYSTKIVVLGSALLLAGWGCTTSEKPNELGQADGQQAYFEQGTARLEVKNQTKGPEVTLPVVVATEDSWAVIRADKSGVPGDIIGYTAVTPGEHKNLTITVDTAKVTPILHANLFIDLGKKGVLEYPGSDVPVTANEVGISGSFTVTN